MVSKKLKRLGIFVIFNNICVKMKPSLEILSMSWENTPRPT